MVKNKKVGAKVIVNEVLVAINPKVKFKNLKKVSGVIVDRGNHEHYYHTSDGGYTFINKQVIKNDAYTTFAIKLDNGIEDIEGNNIIVVREHDLTFTEYLPTNDKPVTIEQYKKALQVVEKYKSQNK